MRKSRLFGNRLRGPIDVIAASVLTAGVISCSGTAKPTPAKTSLKYIAIRNQAGANPFGFSPQRIVIARGTRIVWNNVSSQPHTVTAMGSHPLFNSGVVKLIAPHHQWSFVFRRAGQYSYYCVVHPYMVGVITVRPAS